MAYLLFLDESGRDLKKSPYEVLAGAAVRDDRLWDLVCSLEDAQQRILGVSLRAQGLELKARLLLKTKVFRQIGWHEPFDEHDEVRLSAAALTDGANATRDQLAALAHAKIRFAKEALRLCGAFDVRFFASVVFRGAPHTTGTGLRKDYTYLFQRYTHFLEASSQRERGLVIMDELETSQSRILMEQMRLYFRHTKKGEYRARRIVPEPFFVHSHLTTGIQIADLVAYLVSWNVRLPPMTEPRRVELDELGALVVRRQFRSRRFPYFGFALIRDMRPRSERARAGRRPLATRS